MPTRPDLSIGPASNEADGVGVLVHRAVADARAYAIAELDLVKARAAERATVWKATVVLFAAAGVLALAALIALLVGLILTLATFVGPGGATAIVIGATLLLAAVLALLGKRRLSSKSAT